MLIADPMTDYGIPQGVLDSLMHVSLVSISFFIDDFIPSENFPMMLF